MIDRLPRSASVVALRDSVLRFASREAFEKNVNAHPKTYQALVAILASWLRQADEALAASTFLTASARGARAPRVGEIGREAGRPAMHRARGEDQ